MHIHQINPASLALGLAAILILFLMGRKYPKIPWTLVVIIGSILLISFTDLKEMGIAVVGHVPSGLPPVGVPIIPSSDLTTLFALAGGCFLLAYVEQMGIVKTLSRENDYDIDEDQELLSMGLINLANSLAHGFVVGGSYSRSSVNKELGAKTQLAGGITGLVVMVVIVFFTGLLSNLPHTVLAAIVLVAVLNLVQIREFKRILYISKPEFAIAMTVFFSVILLGLLPGILVGMVLSIFGLVRRFYRPRIVVMGKVPGSDEFAEVEAHPENEQIDDTLVLKIESNLLFFNADNILEDILHCLTRSPRHVKLLVLNLESSPFIDISAADMIQRLHKVLKKRGIDLKVARASALMTERLEKTGLISLLDQTDPGETVTKVIDEWRNLSVSTDGT
jgi:sulfate permease, SulP family